MNVIKFDFELQYSHEHSSITDFILISSPSFAYHAENLEIILDENRTMHVNNVKKISNENIMIKTRLISVSSFLKAVPILIHTNSPIDLQLCCFYFSEKKHDTSCI